MPLSLPTAYDLRLNRVGCTSVTGRLLCLFLDVLECLPARLEQRFNRVLAGILLRSLSYCSILIRRPGQRIGVLRPFDGSHSALRISKQGPFLVFLVSNGEVGIRPQSLLVPGKFGAVFTSPGHTVLFRQIRFVLPPYSWRHRYRTSVRSCGDECRVDIIPSICTFMILISASISYFASGVG